MAARKRSGQRSNDRFGQPFVAAPPDPKPNLCCNGIDVAIRAVEHFSKGRNSSSQIRSVRQVGEFEIPACDSVHPAEALPSVAPKNWLEPKVIEFCKVTDQTLETGDAKKVAVLEQEDL